MILLLLFSKNGESLCVEFIVVYEKCEWSFNALMEWEQLQSGRYATRLT